MYKSFGVAKVLRSKPLEQEQVIAWSSYMHVEYKGCSVTIVFPYIVHGFQERLSEGIPHRALQ